MASSESNTVGENAGGSPVRRAAALAVLSEEPTTGLFPAAPSVTGSAPTSPQAGALTGTRTTEAAGAATTTATATATATAEPAPQATEPETAEPQARPAARQSSSAAAVPTTTEAAASTTETAATATTTANPEARTATESAAETRLAVTTRSGASGTRAALLPPGRPNKPMVAAAVLGGLVLIGLPLLISGPDEKPRATSAEAPAGSPLNPDGSGPGLVPGEQRVSVPSTPAVGGEQPGETPGTTAGEPAGSLPQGPGVGGEGSSPEGGTNHAAPAGESRTDTPVPQDPGQAPSKGSPGANPPATVPENRPSAVTYAHLIGPGCETPGFATGDFYSDGNEGWRGSRGSTTSYGCSGFYYSLPMSGSSRSDGIWAQWKFTTDKVQKGRCSVQVFIPNVRDLSYVGGSPAHYTVYRSFNQKAGDEIGSFTINQPASLGQWISAGTFSITDNKISVVLDNRGNGADNRHAAAAPVRVNCTAS
uniref:Translation initiation factor IF-2 n=1 Tax=Streptomyces sp. NBC_00049 TaxID=2903617 RepID=A0AAU2K1S7_9ACTN